MLGRGGGEFPDLLADPVLGDNLFSWGGKYTNKNTQIHKYKYTNTKTQIQINKYKYTNTNTQIHTYKSSVTIYSVGLDG